MTQIDTALVGVGLYTVPEAERLTRVPRSNIRRWLGGYKFRRADGFREMGPVWHSQIPRIDNTTGLGFLDLMEIRFVNAFRDHGVPWRVIRTAAERACEIFQNDHPFSTQRFIKTDGKKIFAEVLLESGESKLIDLAGSQYAFHRMVVPSLVAGLVFSRDIVTRWYPLWPKQQIVVDPGRAFGRPILVQSGVPTAVIMKAVEIEESAEKVARWYDIKPAAVRAAIAFERRLAA